MGERWPQEASSIEDSQAVVIAQLITYVSAGTASG
jgi:hypothetical protein